MGQLSPDLQLAIEEVRAAGSILERDFSRPFSEAAFDEKNDAIRSLVGKTDIDASNMVVGDIARRTGEKTMTEEYERVLPELAAFIADYYDDNVWCLDPVDGTKDFRDGMLLNPDLNPAKDPRVSVAMVSLAKIVHGRPRLGAMYAPLLGGPPRLYAAEEYTGAFVELNGARQALAADTSHTEGIVLVSENDHPHIERIAAKGLKPVRLGGLVFKMLCVADPALIGTYGSRLTPEVRQLAENEPIVGLISPTAALHDYAAAAVAVREAEALVTTLDGDERLKTGPGGHGIIAATNLRIHGILIDALKEYPLH